MLVACKDAADVSCTIANLLSELELPCGRCNGAGVVLTGTSPTGCTVTVRMLANNVLDVEGGDELLQALMWQYIDAVDGLALGHQTSHIYAVFYVSSIMHFVGEKLHLPLAGMYMDDWYVICPDMATARKALELIRAEFTKLGLELNDKTNIFPLQNGIDFCGFHTYLTQSGKVVRKLRYSSIKRMKRRVRKWEEQYAAGEITREKIMESFAAWEAHAKHGDTGQLRKEMRSRLLTALDRAEKRPGARGLQAPAPGQTERRTNRYGTVTFQSGRRQPCEAEREHKGDQVY